MGLDMLDDSAMPQEVVENTPADPLPGAENPPTALSVAGSARKRDGKDLLMGIKRRDIALRVIAGHTVPQIAEAYGMSTRRVYQMLEDPDMAMEVRQAQADINIESVIRDEKGDAMMRRAAIVTRATTQFAEVIDAINDHVKVNRGNSKATVMKAGVDAFVAAMNHLGGKPGSGEERRVTNVFNVTADKLTLIKQTMDESGLDLSDLFSEDIPDAEIVEDAKTQTVSA